LVLKRKEGDIPARARKMFGACEEGIGVDGGFLGVAERKKIRK